MALQHFSVKVVPNAKINRIAVEGSSKLKVWLNAPPEQNKANEALMSLLADHFKVKKQSISLIRGHKSRQKIVAIEAPVS